MGVGGRKEGRKGSLMRGGVGLMGGEGRAGQGMGKGC